MSPEEIIEAALRTKSVDLERIIATCEFELFGREQK